MNALRKDWLFRKFRIELWQGSENTCPNSGARGIPLIWWELGIWKPRVVAVEELMKWDGIDAVICLGIIGRHELVKQLLESTLAADPDASPEFLTQVEKMGREFEEGFIARMAAFMEAYKKPVIGVSMAGTGKGVVRPVPESRYSGVMYQTPETAVNVLAGMVSYSRFLSKTGGH